MKNFLTTSILLISAVVFAQYPVLTSTSLAEPNDESLHLTSGNYAMDTANERDQYVGTWEYSQGTILFQVKIEKREQYRLGPTTLSSYYSFADVVTFKYRLVKNGQEIFNNLNQVLFAQGDYLPTAIKEGDDNYLQGTFIDKTRNVLGTVMITRLSTSPPKIKFYIPIGTYTLLNTPQFYDDGQPLFSFPTGEIEMVKIL
jgi:hypothetical protein